MSKGYILIALGQNYINEAALLAATIRKQGDDKPISVLVLAQDIEYAKSLNLFTDIVEFQPVSHFFNLCVQAFEKFGTYPKINLIHYAKYDENIFVDTDVLCQYNANDLWEFLSKREEPVAMMGHKIDPQWHWGTIHEVSAAFGKQVPHTHGGFLYFRKTATDFFNFCNSVAYRYDELNCKRWYRGGMCDEIIFALSHAQFGIDPIEFDDKSIMTFNYTPDMTLPSKLQTHNGKLLNDYIPFIHMYDRTHMKAIFDNIIKGT